MSWPSPMVVKLNGTDDNPLGRALTVDESSWVVSLAILGTVAGSLIYGVLGQKFPRKILIASIAIPYLIFYLTMPFISEVWYYYIGRIISGIGGGGSATVLPLYIGEIAKPENRGRVFVLTCIATDLGVLITYSTAPFMPFFWYHLSAAVLPVIFLISFYTFAFESPYDTIQKDPAEAEANLKILMGKNDVSEDISRIHAALNQASGMSFMEVLKSKATRKALIISLGLATFFTFNGIMIVTTYTQTIFEELGGTWSSEVSTIVLQVFKLISTIVSTVFTDRFGRKQLFAVSVVAVAVCEAVLGGYIQLDGKKSDVSSVLSWLPLLSLVGVVIAQSFLSIGPQMAGELFSMEAKNAAMTANTVYNGVLGFSSTFLFQKVQNAIGLGTTFFIFAACSASSLIFIVFVLIETKGKSLEQIQNELDDKRIEKRQEKV